MPVLETFFHVENLRRIRKMAVAGSSNSTIASAMTDKTQVSWSPDEIGAIRKFDKVGGAQMVVSLKMMNAICNDEADDESWDGEPQST